MWFGIWTVAFLAVLASIVVLTLVVENWGRWRQPVHEFVSTGDLNDEAGTIDTAETIDHDREHLDLPVMQDVLEQRADPPVASAVDERDSSIPVVVRLDGPRAADQLVAVLFASYAAQRLPEANRVAAWVTAGERPPSDDGSIGDPGTSLRGRPAAVQRLLDCDGEGRTWVALNEHVDIALGVSRRPPTCDVLAPLVELWRATRARRAEFSDDAVTGLADAIDALSPTWAPTTAAALIEPVAAVLAEAAAGSRVRPVLLTVDVRSESDRAAASASAGDDESDPPDARTEVVTVFA